MGFFEKMLSKVQLVVENTISKGKQAVASALTWMADKAEAFVGNVKNIWTTAEPYVAKIRSALKLAATAATPFPWLKAALVLVDEALGALTDFSKSPVAQKLDEAIKWCIELAKRWRSETAQQGQKETLNEDELRKAEAYQADMANAQKEFKGQHSAAMACMAALNDYTIITTQIKNILEEEGFKNFEHFLRLRATQKLLANAEDNFKLANELKDINADNLFLLSMAASLIKSTPEVCNEDSLRLDEIVQIRFGRPLLPFVFEEMIVLWGGTLKEIERRWADTNKSVSKNITMWRRLDISKRLGGAEQLSQDESIILSDLEKNLPAEKANLETIAKQEREMRSYVYAAEGFVQMLEKSPEQLSEEGREYLLEEGPRVAELIVDCAQRGRAWETLTEDEQSLITDFANIFKEECEARTTKLEMAA